MKYLKSVALAATIALSGGAAQAQDEGGSYVLTTASTGGTYYPVGVALATLVKVKLEPKQKIGMSAISSAGSGENVRLLREDEAQFGILQGLFGYYAATGTGPIAEVGPQENLRSVTMLWQNVEHFIVSSDVAKTGTIEDMVALKGEAMAMGAQNSGTIGSNRTILSGFGVDIDTDYELVYAGYGPSAEALQNGQVKGIGAPGGVPVGAISQLMASAGDSVTLLSMTEEQMAQADSDRGLWTPYVIPGGSYPGLETDVQTIAQPNFLATNADLPEEHVYQLTKAIYENLPFLQAIHPATKVMSIESAIAGLPLPLHPGALRYYQEVGLEIPDRLIAK
ncbi:TAXI family TRAP transporter solute-binding subunit [Marivita sp. XM-24bin2]|jgi:TRAP transporter TAXI family solute receptor|uniref:TAXI family TRAP transporter solute-binding subunit n=1 Tax=unclassified Marivita TaxID=2632480 RepID=UPI000D7A1B43|nr:TAXI family TRAP transporter solute-binding subunit [Marivita sp. XM-24bin2]MCR9109716.1 TAXI family TRAP transporter solute-binding subunit [Paracoccaceae bacterium]PWL35026.1 MAG: C4-dicarboxylate ABC transporter substrate-binding protein [Marivita sp. XM-24bin2]